ncbi:hypothetical protein [Anoxynatronum buryatiense]|uniref:ABM domain-containing protein n=1 Tax=Anoxynatronum buryatiense TaxID=489973 RepID=A0AA46AKH5_9CLOT|nr:hypothetical protein [Anoxynatronum buryatiense]SMP70848.1 hypothetical protein SAMN06296020_12121 [Anoxynatronum buryatiense]
MKEGCVEIVRFDVMQGTEKMIALEAFKLLDAFYQAQEGYFGMNAAQANDDAWILILYWRSKEDEKLASGRMMASEETEGFKQLVIPKTVEKKMYPSFFLNLNDQSPNHLADKGIN